MTRNGSQTPALLSWMDGLADPTRLRLLLLLDEHEIGVAELCEILQMPQSTVSRHLKVLSGQGWVGHRRSGTTNLYRARGEELGEDAAALWALARRQAADWSERAQDALRLEELLRRRQGPGRSFFADAAGRWETLRAEFYGGRFFLAALAAMLPAHWTVADLGCGTGDVALELARRVRRVHAVDESEAMLAGARRRLAGRENVSLHAADLAALPLPDGAVDAALMLLVLSYLDDARGALREMARVLRPGGRAILVDLLAHDREDFRVEMGQQRLGFEREELTEEVAGAGFEGVELEVLPPEPQAKGPALVLVTANRS